MALDQQREVIEFLMAPGTHGGALVDRIDTHISIAIGGLSGSGKSTLAHALTPAIGIAPGARRCCRVA
jgi:ABC-type lipoprotein export system ATPase subunit